MPDDTAFVWAGPQAARPNPPAAPEPAPPPGPATEPAEERLQPARAEEPPAPEAQDSHLLVPRDAWDKILAQLGNLHDAGQQLAAARERAAKAETEVAFLRERLAELRERLEPPEPPAAEPAPEPPPAPADSLQARLTNVWRALRGS